MDPSYQQAMIQALMGKSTMPTPLTGQDPTSAYGTGFMTGNTMMPFQGSSGAGYGQPSGQAVQNQPGYASNSLTQNPSTVLQQPTSNFSM